MEFNSEKSEHLTIIAAPDHVNNTAVYMENAKIPVCQTHKHLGLYVDEQLCLREDINKTFTAYAQKSGTLRRLKGKLSDKTIGRIYKGFTRPSMEYA